jgi:ADP-heptose:LPS heptosyltransferase
MDSEQSKNDGNQARRIKIAVVSFDSLGDSLLYLLLAYNLHQNNFDVTYFGNVGHQLSEWIPILKTLPYPDIDHIEEALADYDLVIKSPRKLVRNRMETDSEYLARLKSKYILVCQKAPVSWVCDHTQRLSTTLPPDQCDCVNALAKASGSIRFRRFKDESTVDILCAYMREKMQLSVVSRQVAIMPPPHLRFRRFEKRIIVSPDSAGPEDKNWGKQQFLSLCRQLKSIGYQPVIVVSPANYNEWQLLNRDEFELPLFNNIGDLASFIFESVLMVANDSGNGHLASFLGVPVVTIYKKRNPRFHWRPDWSAGKVVCPRLVVKFFNYRVWRPFVSIRQVLAAIFELLARYNKS